MIELKKSIISDEEFRILKDTQILFYNDYLAKWKICVPKWLREYHSSKETANEEGIK